MLSQKRFPHFMLQEIYAQPEVMQTCLSTYLTPPSPPPFTLYPSSLHFSLSPSPINLGIPASLYSNLQEVHIIACGTSRHAGLVAQFWLEQLAALPTRIRSGSEFQEAPFPLTRHTLTIGVTQSGETADTLNGLELEKNRRSSQESEFQPRLVGITNQPASSLAQRVDVVLPTLAGLEVGVAATKTFTSQLLVFYLLAMDLAYRRQMLTHDRLQQHLAELSQLPTKIRSILEQEGQIKDLAHRLIDVQHSIILGRGINRAIALEGALKLKETTYVHAEGYTAGEFMHGPIALLDAGVPVIAIITGDATYPAMLATVQTAKSHGAPAIGIVTKDIASETASLFDQQFVLPTIRASLSPLLTIIPLQLLAYHLAVQRGLNVDKPRNIMKTITA